MMVISSHMFLFYQDDREASFTIKQISGRHALADTDTLCLKAYKITI